MSVKTSEAMKSALESIHEALRALEDAHSNADADTAHSEAATAFASALAEVLGDRSISLEAARRAALIAAAGVAWEDAVGPLLTAAQAREVLGSVSRQRLNQLVGAERIIALQDSTSNRRFPAWQFGDRGRPSEPLAAAYYTLVRDGALSPWTAASWLVHPHPELQNRSPRDWALLGDSPRRLAVVASRYAARAAQ